MKFLSVSSKSSTKISKLSWNRHINENPHGKQNSDYFCFHHYLMVSRFRPSYFISIFNLKSKKDIYDVLDGKQRIETILHFIELIKLKGEDKLWVEFINPRNNKKDYLSYDELSSRKVNKEYENILEKFFNIHFQL